MNVITASCHIVSHLVTSRYILFLLITILLPSCYPVERETSAAQSVSVVKHAKPFGDVNVLDSIALGDFLIFDATPTAAQLGVCLPPTPTIMDLRNTIASTLSPDAGVRQQAELALKAVRPNLKR